jgi:anti-sigma regulatory factor (Ser/Thr protein kinase)
MGSRRTKNPRFPSKDCGSQSIHHDETAEMSDASESEWSRDRIRVTLPNDLAHVAVARSAVRSAAQPYGYSTSELDHWEVVVEEAMTNVVQFAYDPEERASFDIDCLLGANGLTVRIRDRGRPFDARRIKPIEFDGDPQTTPQRGLGWHLMHRLMDVVAVESLGRDGKQLTLFKAAPHRFDPEALPARKRARGQPREPVTDVVFRRATADDAIEVMRLFYDCYRYSYFNEQVYSPQALGRMIASGEIDSFVAALPSGRLVAHLALIRDPNRPNAIECGMAAADPAYPGHHLFNKTAMLAAEQILHSRKTIVFAGCVTAHVASQKIALHGGANECGLMLGAVPAEDFAGLKRKDHGRGTILFVVQLLAERAPPALVLPPDHEAFIAGLYERCRIPFTRGTAGPFKEGHTDITISVRPKVGTVRATVQRIGGDLIDRIKAMMHGARQSRADVGQLFLPLTDPALPHAVAGLEPLGWFVTGILPEGGTAGDVLLMHWLNGWAMDYDAVEMARLEGRQLLKEVRDRDPEWR